MRIFVFAYDRFDTMTTSMLLEREGLPHRVLCHDSAAAESFRRGGRVAPQRVEATDVPKGLANARNAALERMAEGEWALFLVDDLIAMQQLDGYDEQSRVGALPISRDNQREWRKRLAQPIAMRRFLDTCASHIHFAERAGCRLVGFAGYDNPLFRARHWKINTLADGRAWLVRKSYLRFDPNVQMIDDVCWTALNIAAFGTVLVDAWTLPLCQRYTAGGYGSIEQRLPQKRREADYLVRTYPQWIRFADKAGWPPRTHVAIRRLGQ